MRTTLGTSPIPFPFVLDELAPVRPTIKRAFGFTYIYLDERLLCCLRNSLKQPNSNGMWLFTTTEHLDSLALEFPNLSRRYLWRSGRNAWIVLASKLEGFEEFAFKACELILNNDRRIGRLTRSNGSQPSKDNHTNVARKVDREMPEPGKLILKAAKSGDVPTILKLLATDPKLVDARDSDGSTPLHCAVWKGHQHAVAALLKAGADVNAVNQNGHWGTTPLHAAAHANQAAIAELLLANGANPKATDDEGRTPLFHTTFHKAKAAAKILEQCEK